jgi:hypothetical protein
MVADSMWTFAMACNVYLTFFRKYDAKQLRSLEWKYILFCYGVPFIPAFTFFFVRSKSRGKVYGSAVVSLTRSSCLSSGLELTFLVMVLDNHRMGCPARRHQLRTYLAHDRRNLRNLHIRRESGVSMASPAAEVFPKSPQ